jgi:hypothetical protein
VATELAYKGEEKTNLDLRAITEFVQAFNCSLADGKSEVELEYDKSDTGSVLTITTTKPVPKEKTK